MVVFDFKFTGKYSTKTNINKDNKYDTYEIISTIIIRIDTDNDLQKSIEKEVGKKWPVGYFATSFISPEDQNGHTIPNMSIPGFVKYHMKYETNENIQLNSLPMLQKNLYNCTKSLSIQGKMYFSLGISGIHGHLWDHFLRYFTYDTSENLNNELELMIQKNISLVPVEYYGSPLASYMYDFRNESNSNMLGGYNIIKFSKLFGLGIISFRDKLISKAIYIPLKYPNVLFPIVYKNGILNIYSKTYRSYKHLLKQMNTR